MLQSLILFLKLEIHFYGLNFMGEIICRFFLL